MTPAVPTAWVALPSEAEIRSGIPDGAPPHPYDFGFLPAMIRLVRANRRLGKTLGVHYAEVMFGAGTLDRREREMIAAVASAAQDCTY
jgi:hypothetical protein